MKIICIGRNYISHINELKNEITSEPVIFMKPDSSLLRNNEPFYIPDFSNNIHHEIELVVRINRLGKNIEKRFAYRYYDEIGLGIDFTARDLQEKLKSRGLPWEICKGFDRAAAISNKYINRDKLPDIHSIKFCLKKNGKLVQNGNSARMIFSFDSLIEHISKYFTLKIGDLIFTGTPAGVGNVKTGDRLEGFLEDEKLLDILIK